MELSSLVRRNGSRGVFEALKRFPDRMFTINELAKTAKIPFTTAWRIVNEWEKAGVIEVFSIGRARAVKLGKGAINQNLSDLFFLDSPHKAALSALRGILAKETGISIAYLFGSVASGKEGFGSDVDIAILAKMGYSPTNISMVFYNQTRLKLVPLVFGSKKELDAFLKDKESVRLK
jgi:predicted nucleotidyltransferase